MNKGITVILMGSPSDLPHVEKITNTLAIFGIASEQRIASAHKTPGKLLDILEEYENHDLPKVYITVAGRSNALSGLVDAQVRSPVIACPPSSDSFGGADIFSSLRMPSGVAPMVVLDPANAALAAAKILAIYDPEIKQAVLEFQRENSKRLTDADMELKEPDA
jgi:5-(carboxyamino)imidazole ribonucleotide mutase